MAQALKMHHDSDPKKDIMEAVAPYLDGFNLPPFKFLVAIYKRPEKMASGLLLPGNQGPRKEDEWQGKVGLIVKMGPFCFEDDKEHRWGPNPPKLGDWIAYNVGDTWPFLLWSTKCRWLSEEDWRMTLKDPDCVY